MILPTGSVDGQSLNLPDESGYLHHFFSFKSAPLKVLTMAAMSPSWVS
jgi:hypothetical protein